MPSVFLNPFLLYDILLIAWSSPFHLNWLVPKPLGATFPRVPELRLLVQRFMPSIYVGAELRSPCLH